MSRLSKDVTISKEAWNKAIKVLQTNPDLLLRIPPVLQFLTQERLEQISIEDIQALDNGERVQDHTLRHNLAQMKEFPDVMRPLRYMSLLYGIDYVYNNSHKLKILDIGPRTESELFVLFQLGFRPENITALDLISYSDFVELGDMHDMPYEDDSFDIVIAGWVLAYSKDNHKAASEIARVCRPGGYVFAGCNMQPVMEEVEHLVPKAEGGIHCVSKDDRFEEGTVTVARYFDYGQLERLFAPYIDETVFKSTRNEELSEDEGQNAVILFRNK